MLREKTSAIRYNKNYNHNFEFMSVGGVVGSGGVCDSNELKQLKLAASELICFGF